MKKRFRISIKKGEDWLRKAVRKRSGCAFWGADNRISKNINPNVDERSRMEYIFTSFYALMGLVNPEKYPEDSLDDRDIIRNAYHFFRDQAEWFSGKYTSTAYLDKLSITDFAKIASSVGRIINAFILIKIDCPPGLMEGLKEVIFRCENSSYMTTSITINTHNIGQTGETYNNNTPFDMGMALVNLDTDTKIIEKIISVYIDHQETEGFWFLSFSSAYTIKTWTTSEALIFLESATRKYHIINNIEIEAHARQRVDELTERLAEKENQLSVKKAEYEQNYKECKKEYERIYKTKLETAQKYSTIFAVISCILSALLIVASILISQLLPEIHPLISNVLNYFWIPLVGNIFYDISKAIKINKKNGGE